MSPNRIIGKLPLGLVVHPETGHLRKYRYCKAREVHVNSIIRIIYDSTNSFRLFWHEIEMWQGYQHIHELIIMHVILSNKYSKQMVINNYQMLALFQI